MFFINPEVCKRTETYELNFLEPDKLQLTIYNFLSRNGNETEEECIDFIFCGAKPEDAKSFYRGFCLNEKIEEIGENEYQISSDNTTGTNVLYALIRGTQYVNDEIFIPSNMRDNVEVIRRIRPVDKKQNYGTYLGNVYLIKVTLDDYECLPIYYAHEKTKVLMYHDVIYKTKKEGNYRTYNGLRTYILLNDNNRAEYIALSKLL